MSSRDMLCTAPCQSMWDSRRRYFFEAALRIESRAGISGEAAEPVAVVAEV